MTQSLALKIGGQHQKRLYVADRPELCSINSLFPLPPSHSWLNGPFPAWSLSALAFCLCHCETEWQAATKWQAERKEPWGLQVKATFLRSS